jgi:hypothetical protein
MYLSLYSWHFSGENTTIRTVSLQYFHLLTIMLMDCEAEEVVVIPYRILFTSMCIFKTPIAGSC